MKTLILVLTPYFNDAISLSTIPIFPGHKIPKNRDAPHFLTFPILILKSKKITDDY